MLSSPEPSQKDMYDVNRGLKAFRLACVEGGDTVSCGLAGAVLMNDNTEVKLSEEERRGVAEDMFRRGCEGGYARCCFNLAVMYKKCGDKEGEEEEKGI